MIDMIETFKKQLEVLLGDELLNVASTLCDCGAGPVDCCYSIQ